MALLMVAAVYLSVLCDRDLWSPDEPRFAQVAKEMLQSGDWLVPHFVGQPLALLPPMTYWMSAATSLPFGEIDEWTARIGLVGFSLVALGATMLLADRAALPAGLVLLSSVKFLHQAQYLQADMPLVACQTWALAALYRGYTVERSRRLWLGSAYLATAIAILSKGPVGALLPAAVFGLFLIWERDLRALTRMGLLWGVLLVLVLCIPWYAMSCSAAGEDFCRELLVKHNLGMFFDTWSHKRPFYYYLLQLPWMFLPWTLVLPAALRPLQLCRRTRFLITWALFCLLFFSASDAKQAKYLLPILPPLAIMVAHWLQEAATPRALRLSGGIWAALLLCGLGVAVMLLPERFPDLTSGAVTTIGSAVAIAAVSPLLAARREVFAWLLAASVLLPALVAHYTLLPALATYKSPRALIEAARAVGDPAGIYGISYRQTGGLVFYSGRPLPVLESRAELDALMSEDGVRLVYMDREDWTGAYPVVAESPYRGGTLLVTNQKGG